MRATAKSPAKRIAGLFVFSANANLLRWLPDHEARQLDGSGERLFRMMAATLC
jgi:hypothetical protein